MQHKLMYKVSQSTGKVQVWKSWSKGNIVFVEHGELHGKYQTQTYTTEPKNVGKINETTAEEQAKVEVTALYQDRYENKHYRDTVEAATILAGTCKEPRKIHNFKDHAHKLPQEVYFSIKLNGSRACILGGNLYSKVGRKEDIKVKHIRDAVRALGSVDMDCEVYGYGLSLQRIRSAWLKPVKTDKEIIKLANDFNSRDPLLKDKVITMQDAINCLGYNPNEDADKLKLFVFDIPVTDIPFKDRVHLIDKLQDEVNSLGLQDSIGFVDTYLIDKDDVLIERDEVHSKGFEGGVVYSPDDMYEFGKRSYSCQKTKPRLDSEALVLDCIADKSGQGVLLLRTNEEMGSVTFKAKMKGDAASRSFSKQQQFIGKWVTFSYEELSDAGKPTKPVVHETRLCDKDGNPLE